MRPVGWAVALSEICGFQCGPWLSVGPVAVVLAVALSGTCGCPWHPWQLALPVDVSGTCGCQEHLWPLACGLAVSDTHGCQWHWLLGWRAVSGTHGGPCDAGYHSCWWRLWLSVGLEVTGVA